MLQRKIEQSLAVSSIGLKIRQFRSLAYCKIHSTGFWHSLVPVHSLS